MTKLLVQIDVPTTVPATRPTARPSVLPKPSTAPSPLPDLSVTPLPSLFPSPTAAITPAPSSSSSAAAPASESATSIVTITSTPTPSPIPTVTPTPVPISNILNAIKSPLATLLQNPASSFAYTDRSLSPRTNASLLLIATVLVVLSFISLQFMKKSIGRYWYIFLILGIAIIVGTLYLNNSLPNQTRSFSSYTLLSSSWQKYKERFIKSDGRVVDENGMTTSEAQSYAMLQSVWADDMNTFNRVWSWTNRNLKRPNDNLFGWRYGKRSDDTLGFLPSGGDNSASDADSDIAYALLIGSRRWHNNAYRAAALPVLKSMWETEVATASGKLYLTAGNWAQSDTEIVINPSYFAPYAWRIFAQEDKSHDWMSLIGPAYDLLGAVGRNNLDKQSSAGLPPDWVSLTRDGQIKPTNLPNLDTDYSFDAIRTPWRIALDYQQNNEPRALAYLNTLGFLIRQYQSGNRLSESYSHDGKALSGGESPVMYATALGALMYVRPDLADKMYQDKILNLYSTDSDSFRQNLSYYEENWLWFGSALYLKALYKF